MLLAEHFIKNLNLEKHIEGGYFREIFRSNKTFTIDELHDERSLASTIYFLLKSGEFSKFHRLKFDEIWFFHFGCPIIIHKIDEDGNYSTEILGINFANNENPQILIPANTIFGAEPSCESGFSLVSCMVSPGFDFRDFEIFDEKLLQNQFPEHSEIIHKLNGKNRNSRL
jgi:predicted cupin superfamily sugar epimerase